MKNVRNVRFDVVMRLLTSMDNLNDKFGTTDNAEVIKSITSSQLAIAKGIKDLLAEGDE